MKHLPLVAASLFALVAPAFSFEVILDNGAPGFTSFLNPPTEGVPILMYHGLDAEHGQDPAGFDAQMDYLAANGFTCITLDHLADWIETGTPALPARPIVITFDDVYLSVYTVAYPKMKALSDDGYTIFGYNYAHTDYVGVPPGGPPPTSYDHTDWDESYEMEVDGIMFTESHTVTHANLTTLSYSAQEAQLINSKQRIEDEYDARDVLHSGSINKVVRHIAYPFGAYNADTITIATAAGYRTATTTIPGLNTQSTPLLELRRYDVNANMFTNSTFTSRANAASGSPWITSTSEPGYIGANYAYAAAGSGEAVATWLVAIPATGPYRVEARWAQNANRATNAPYTIVHAGGETTVTVNQQIDGGTWVALGDVTFTGGEQAIVRLSNDANGFVIADGIRITSLSTSVPDWAVFD